MAKSAARNQFEGNPISLSKEVAGELAAALDVHVASLFTLFHLYQKHHWLVEGPQFRDLHLYLGAAYDEVHKDLDALAERMTVLGGTPTSNPVNQASLSFIGFEEEGGKPIRESLSFDLKAEATICVKLRETIARARQLGDFGTAHLLEETLGHAENRAHHLEHYLAKDGLCPGPSPR